MKPKLELRDITKMFASDNERPLIALNDINLSINESDVVVIIGPSGCGKTTLLKIIAGLENSYKGEVILEGKSVKAPGPDRCMVSQMATLLPWRTVIQNVEFSKELLGIPKADRKKESLEYLKLVGLEQFAFSYPFELSGGMRQRAALAAALMSDPEIILLDEPFGALDAQTRKDMQEELLRLLQRTKKTALLVTHSIEEAIWLSDRIVIITARPGRVKEVVQVNLPHPRNRTSSEFIEIRKVISEMIEEEVKLTKRNHV
ncbi:MAG: ABC transporter ATP-binding protein [Nanoarchaeota archaeon]|nr:ABC transporter ATP-binding protein [Nanoarchaeota archaeon]